MPIIVKKKKTRIADFLCFKKMIKMNVWYKSIYFKILDIVLARQIHKVIVYNNNKVNKQTGIQIQSSQQQND